MTGARPSRFAVRVITSAALTVPRPDVVIATSPPLSIAVPGYLSAKVFWRNVPWVFEVRDLWPGSIVTSGLLREEALLTRVLYGMERWACESATLVNVLTPAFRDDIVKRGLVPSEKIVFVPNGADVSMFNPGPRDNDARREFGWGEGAEAGQHGDEVVFHRPCHELGIGLQDAARRRVLVRMVLQEVGGQHRRDEAGGQQREEHRCQKTRADTHLDPLFVVLYVHSTAVRIGSQEKCLSRRQ